MLPGRPRAAGAGCCASTSPAGAALAVSIRSTLNLASARAAFVKLRPITCGTGRSWCAEVGLPEALDLGCVDALRRGAGLASLQAPRFRTYSRASGETEAHSKGCAVAAVAPSSNAAHTRHEILPRFMALRLLRAGKLAVTRRGHAGYPSACRIFQLHQGYDSICTTSANVFATSVTAMGDPSCRSIWAREMTPRTRRGVSAVGRSITSRWFRP